MIAIVVLHASWVGLGLLLLRRLPGARDWPVPLAVACGYFTGALVHVLALQCLLLTHAEAAPLVWTLIAAGLLALPLQLRALRAACVVRAPPTTDAARTQGADRTAWRGIDVALALLLLPPAALIALQLVGLPDVSYDSVAFWNLKGAWFFHGVRLDDAAFTDPLRVHANPDYPLYRPIFTWEHYLLLGGADDHSAKPGYALQLLAGLALLFALLRDAAGRTTALAALALLLWTPIMAAASIPGSPGTTYVDFPLGLQFAAGLGLLLRALRTHAAADVAAAMLASTTAVLMKNEGAIWCALLLPLGATALLLAQGRVAWRVLAWLALPAAVLLLWKQVAAGIVPQVYIRAPTPAQIVRLPEVAPRMYAAWCASLCDVARWGVLGGVLVAGCCAGVLRQLLPARGRPAPASATAPAAAAPLAARPRRTRMARVLLALVPLGQLCAVLLGVMLLELQKGGLDNWMAHAWDRLILQLVPSALLLTVVLNVRSAGAASPVAAMPVAHDSDAARLSA